MMQQKVIILRLLDPSVRFNNITANSYPFYLILVILYKITWHRLHCFHIIVEQFLRAYNKFVNKYISIVGKWVVNLSSSRGLPCRHSIHDILQCRPTYSAPWLTDCYFVF